ncbi:helix-turn-helix domain-containing protein [Candidatus Poriferisodalis sp.]|uniref:helix-turn-helix domain-containing protein n=1 Tax=Candidatus Poriferisodalis sp. TaxID=3101277 RepID=UPI003B01347A
MRAALAAREMSVEKLARDSRLNRRSLDQYFRGDSPSPSFFVIVTIARHVRVDLSELADFVEESE